MIDLDGLTVVGPGSEWFWAMLQMILLVVTGLVIWRQLRAQAATNAVQQLDSLYGRWHSGLFSYVEMELALHVKHEGMGSGTYVHAEPVLELMEDVGHLWTAGHVRLDDMGSFSRMFQNWWTILGPRVELWRSTFGTALYRDAERIVTALAEQDARHGLHHLVWAQEDWCDGVILNATARLTRERNLQAGILPPVPTAQASPE